MLSVARILAYDSHVVALFQGTKCYLFAVGEEEPVFVDYDKQFCHMVGKGTIK